MGRKVLAIAIVSVFALAWGFAQRRKLAIYSVSLQDPPPLAEAIDQGPKARWVDDYYTIEEIDERTFAIGEPRFSQQNFNYLILGSERAVLFDAGPGVRDIRPIVESITDLPITFVPSHFHYDHVGADIEFERVALPLLANIRARVTDGRLSLEKWEHLGFVEGVPARSFEVREWLELGASMSLGDRELRVIYTPGHTPDSISLFDESSGYLFSGDFLYPGALYGFLPNSSMREYLSGSEALVAVLPESVRIFGAHRTATSGLPELAFDDVKDLRETLEAVQLRYQDGEGGYPDTFRVNDRIDLLAEPRWMQRW